MFLAICAIIKNEGPYLKEWIAFHLLQGVEHFFLYDNGSTDDTEEILSELIERNIVTYKPFPGNAMQLPAYADCLRGLKMLSADSRPRWLAFIDVDEFLHTTNHKNTIAGVLKEYEDACAVVVHWMLYGSNGNEKKDGRLCIERFTASASSTNPHVKSIVQPEYAEVYRDPHSFANTGSVVNERNDAVADKTPLFFDNPSSNILRISHFVTKSREECLAKCLKGRSDTGTSHNFDTFFVGHDCKDVQNSTLTPWVEPVKTKINELWPGSIIETQEILLIPKEPFTIPFVQVQPEPAPVKRRRGRPKKTKEEKLADLEKL